MSRNQRLVLAGMLGILAVLVLSFMLILISIMGTQSTAMIRGTPTPAPPTATPTPPPLAITAQQGWLTASTHLAFTQDIQFAQSNPYVGYACGVAKVNGPQTPLQLSITNDGGRTWHAQMPTALKYPSCGMQINPVYDNWLLLTAMTCFPICYGGQFPDHYVSHDYGHTWIPLKVPAGDNTSVVIRQVSWAGTDVLLNAIHYTQQPDPTIPTHLIAASINGGPLQWVDNAAFYTQMGTHPQSVNTQGVGAVWQVTIDDKTIACTNHSGCLLMMQSNDHGATWQRTITLTSIGSYSVQASADGKALFGEQTVKAGESALVVSRDQGQTWQKLPAEPTLGAGSRSSGIIFAAPDSTLFITYTVFKQQSNQTLIYNLAANSTAWQVVDSGTSGSTLQSRSLVSISIGPGGHPVALWAILQTFTTSPAPATSTATYHAPTGG